MEALGESAPLSGIDLGEEATRSRLTAMLPPSCPTTSRWHCS